MSDRFTLLYRFSTDYGLTWTDLTPQVDSRQTAITQNLCTNNFTSAKDEATFVMPETPLFEPDGVTPTPKKKLIDALMGSNDILIEINAPGSVDVLWDGDDVLWNGEHVQWHGSVRYFTGYADKSSMDLRSYPLPPRLTVKVQDVSVLHLDDKVDRNVLLENKKISQIVSALLGYAGYVDIGNTSLDNSDDETLEAFVIDKDKARTYRQYIDDLLFEAGGYVLDFNEDGQANVIHLQWDGSASASRTIDNPMNSDGVTLRSAWLKEDGVKIKWSSLAWAYGERIWQADISQEIDSGVLVGETVHSGRYWPDGGELDPVYMEYDAKLLDSEYLTRASRRENKDLTVIMAKNMSARIDAMQNGSPFTGWTRVDPTSWPAGDNWNDKYGIPTNPAYWPTKAWHLLYNGTGSDVSLTFFALYGDVLYRSKVNTVEMSGSKNPKEYESTYIYNQTHAERFAQFWWHFLQTSRYQFTWSEPNRRSPLNDVVAVGVKGSGSTQKALIAGKTYRWINDNVEIISYTAVGIDTYSPSSLVPISIVPSSSKPQKQPTTGAKTATFSTTPSYTLAQWESFGTTGMAQSWTVTNPSDFTAGDVAIITGKISDMDDTAIHLYMNVSDVTGSVISGTGIKIEYLPVLSNWDFDIGQSTVPRNDRIPWNPNDSDSYTDIHLTSKQTGIGVLEYWSCDGTSSPLLTYFVGANAQTTTGSAPILRIYKQETYPEITVTMRSSDNVYSVTKKITIVNETEYDHDFAVWEPTDDGTNIYILPDHFTVSGVDYDIIKGDYFVSKVTFAPYSSGTAVVSPTGDPSAQGWYERKGNGTGAKPYYWLKTLDTSVVGGKTYGTVASGNQKYEAGYAYIYSGSSWDGFDITDEASARKASNLLNDLVTGNVQIPESSSNFSMWKWAKNFVSQNAVINNLFSQAITVMSGGYIMGGSRYSSSGTIADWTKKGFWFSYDGTLKANLQSDNAGNTFVGTGVGVSTQTGGSPTGNYNTGIGYQALNANTTGDYNVGIGYQSLLNNSTGQHNIGIGSSAMGSNTSGQGNIAIGAQSLQQNSTGGYNTAIGYLSQMSSSGNNNTSLGHYSLINATGDNNVAIGQNAMIGSGSGSRNIGIGTDSLWYGINGNDNIGIGYRALRLHDSGNNNIAIGSSADVVNTTGSYQMNINNTLIYMEFNGGVGTGRNGAEIYNELHKYYPGYEKTVGCLGTYSNVNVTALIFKASSVVLIGPSGQTFVTLSASQSSLYSSERVMFLFINPLIGPTDRDDSI